MSGWLGGEVRWWWWCAQQRANTNDKLFRCRGRLILDTYFTLGSHLGSHTGAERAVFL